MLRLVSSFVSSLGHPIVNWLQLLLGVELPLLLKVMTFAQHPSLGPGPA